MVINELNSNSIQKPTIKSVFTNKDFSRLWIGQLVSNTGSSISLIIFPLFIYLYSDSIFWLGLVAFVEFIPILFFSSFAGIFVDSHNRKFIMILSDLLNAILIFFVPVLITFDSILSQLVVLVGISILVFLASTVNRFFLPARYASIPRLVKDDEIGIAVSISQTTNSLISILGPILGVIIASIAGYNAGFLIDAGTFVLSAFMIIQIKSNLNPLKEKENNEKEKPSLFLGLKSVLEIKTIRYLILTFSFTVFADSVLVNFLVAYVKTELQMSDIGYGIAFVLYGASGIVTGIILTKIIPRIKKPILLVTIAYLFFGLVDLPFLFITKDWQLFAITLFGGLFDTFIFIPLNVVIIRDTVDTIRGQVTSAFDTLNAIFTIAGIVFGVIFAPLIGLRLLFFLNGVIIVLIALFGLGYLLFIENLDKISV